MSGVKWKACTPEITTGTAALSLLKLTAASNHREYVDHIDVSLKGIVVTDAPAMVRIYKATTAGTFTALTPVHDGIPDAETIQLTAGHTATAEPTKTDLLGSGEVHPQTGRRFGPFWLAGGGSMVVEITTANSTSAIVEAGGEE